MHFNCGLSSQFAREVGGPQVSRLSGSCVEGDSLAAVAELTPTSGGTSGLAWSSEVTVQPSKDGLTAEVALGPWAFEFSTVRGDVHTKTGQAGLRVHGRTASGVRGPDGRTGGSIEERAVAVVHPAIHTSVLASAFYIRFDAVYEQLLRRHRFWTLEVPALGGASAVSWTETDAPAPITGISVDLEARTMRAEGVTACDERAVAAQFVQISANGLMTWQFLHPGPDPARMPELELGLDSTFRNAFSETSQVGFATWASATLGYDDVRQGPRHAWDGGFDHLELDDGCVVELWKPLWPL